MEKVIIRSVALLCGLGGLGLAWIFGVFTAIPIREGRVFSMAGTEIQLIGVSLVACLAVAWGSLHLLSLADKVESRTVFKILRAIYGIVLAAAGIVGAAWSMQHVVTL